MKNLVLLFAFAAIIISCKKSDNLRFITINPNAMIYFKPATSNAKTLPGELTPLEIVKKAKFLVGYNDDTGEQFAVTWTWFEKDTVSEPPALLRWGKDIIYEFEGCGGFGIQSEFINSYDLVICTGNLTPVDTIAYIPQSNMTTAKLQIIEAFVNQDTTLIYEVFKNSFKFIPITGAEWRDLKAHGLN